MNTLYKLALAITFSLGVAAGSMLVAAPSAEAHGGGLNRCGCHFNRKTGECHCHQNRGCGCECEPASCG